MSGWKKGQASMRNLRTQRFGRLVVICLTNKRKWGNIVWLCRCDCGNLVEILSNSLLRGLTNSCGCLRIEKAKQLNTTHGDKGKVGIRLYRIWAGMKTRCLNSNRLAYKWYGKRGISVCEEWINNYQAFKFWALLNGYVDNLTIDRINNDGNYEPSNCHWITTSENSKKPKHKYEKEK